MDDILAVRNHLCCCLQNLKKYIAPAVSSHHNGTAVCDKQHTLQEHMHRLSLLLFPPKEENHVCI